MLCYQLFFPPFAICIIIPALCSFKKSILKYIGESDDDESDNGESDHDKKSKEAVIKASKISVIILCALFWVYAFSLDCCALVYRDGKIQPEISQYNNKHYTQFLYDLPGATVFYDLIPIAVALIYLIVGICKVCLDNGEGYFPLNLLFLYSLFTVMTVISNHLMYLLIAFINDSVHATGILTYYLIFVAVYLISMKKIIAQSIQYHSDCEDSCAKCCLCLTAVTICTIVSIILMGLAAMVIVLYVYIPIKDSIHDVPKQIQSLFQLATTFFLGLITYKVFRD